MKLIRIIGIGNIMAGDDAIGPLILRTLKAKLHDNVELIEAGLSGLGVLDLMKGADTVIFVDAVQGGETPGTVHRLIIPNDLGILMQTSWSPGVASTHGFGLGETLTLSHTLDALPPRTLVYGIELGQTHIGTEVSVKVKEAIDNVALAIDKDVEAYLCTNSSS